MKFLKNPKFLIFLIVFVNFLGYGIVFPILPLMTQAYGGNPLISGILIGIFSLMQMVAMPVLGKLSDRFGRKPLLIFSLWGTVLSFAIMGITHSILWLLIARIIDGISGGNLSIAQAYLADKTPIKDRASAMGIIGAGISLGFILGPIWGGLFAKISLSAPFIAAAIITFISVMLSQMFLTESVTERELTFEKKHLNLSHVAKEILRKDLMILYIINLFLFWAQSGFNTTMSLFAKDVLGITIAKVSLILAFGGILSAIIQGYALKFVIKAIDEKKLYIVSSVCAVISMVMLGYSSNLFLYTISATLLMIATAFLGPLTTGFVSERSKMHEQGLHLGVMQSFGSIGRIIGPIAAGYIYEASSPFAPSFMGAGALGVALILGLLI